MDFRLRGNRLLPQFPDRLEPVLIRGTFPVAPLLPELVRTACDLLVTEGVRRSARRLRLDPLALLPGELRRREVLRTAC